MLFPSSTVLVLFMFAGFAAINKKLGEVWWSIPLKEKNVCAFNCLSCFMDVL